MPKTIVHSLFVFCFIAFVIQAVYYLYFYLRTALHKPGKHSGAKPGIPVSIIVCARNEAKNLEVLLPQLLHQTAGNYEVIIVDDQSTDNTKTVLEKFANYPNLQILHRNIKNSRDAGKKAALAAGIEAAQYEWLLLTDADCRVTKRWLLTMRQNFIPKNAFVLAYGGYEKKKGLLNKMIRYDTVFIAMQYAGFALRGIPYMGVGRNLAYRKSVFTGYGGFQSHRHVLSGDDDLWINQQATKSNTAVELQPESFTYSEPETSLIDWMVQKRRHFSTAKYYKTRHLFWLGGEIFSRLVFYLLFVVLLVAAFSPALVALFLMRWLVLFPVFFLICRRFKEKDLPLYFPFFDLILPVFNLFIYLSYIFYKKIEWKK